MSPAPLDAKSNDFSNLVRSHPRVVQSWDPMDDTHPCIWAVNDHAMFSRNVSPFHSPVGPPTPFSTQALAIQGALTNINTISYTATRLATLYPGTGSGEVDLVHLRQTNGQPIAGNSIFGVVSALRGLKAMAGHEREVSPNHVLIPAWEGDGCPYGPPRDYRGLTPPKLPEKAKPDPKRKYRPAITLLDSGYVWRHWWGENPLAKLLGHAQTDPTQALWWDEQRRDWAPCPPNVVDAHHPNAPRRIDALVGHANFVAGLLAHRSHLPELVIWNHNGSYVADQTLQHVTTEFSVLHNLYASQHARPTKLIVLVFAFPTFEGVLSTGWDSMMSRLQAINPDFAIVCPVGNQGASDRRYPAALATVDPRPHYIHAGVKGNTAPATSANKAYANVIGVASLDRAGNVSAFSNRNAPATAQASADPWVTCAAVGEEVASTFLHLDLPTQDRPWPLGTPPGPHDFKPNAWALWQGTCFAAPKIAAAIANELRSDSDHVMEAWDRAKSTHSPATDPEVGLTFRDLG